MNAQRRSVLFRSRQRGVSLIEVLVALLLLAIGVLGAAALQLNALKYNQAASARTQATFLAYDMADRMRANRNQARSNNYAVALGAAAPTGSTIADLDRAAWLNALAQQLPAGTGSVVRTANTNVFTITVQWDESRIGGPNAQQFIFVTEL